VPKSPDEGVEAVPIVGVEIFEFGLGFVERAADFAVQLRGSELVRLGL
jgi:hypothetical protein